MTKLGIGSYTYGWAFEFSQKLPFDTMDLLCRAKKHDINLVQIGDNSPLHLLNEEKLEELLLFSQENLISIEVGTRGLKPEILDTYIPLTKRFKSPILRMVIDDKEFEPSASDVIAIVRSYLSELKKSNVVLAIENHDRFSVKTLANIIESLGSEHVGICLDTVNSIGAAEGAEMVVDYLGPYTVNLHVKDFNIKRVPYLMGFNVFGSPAGQGMLNIPWLIEKLSQHNRKPNAILELWTPPEATPEETIEKENSWAIESIAYLKTLMKNKSYHLQ